MYADDYDGNLMPSGHPPTPGVRDQDRTWSGLVQPYLKNGGGFPARGVMVCPSWSEAKLLSAGRAPGCDGGPAHLTVIEMYAHYGIYLPMRALAGSGTPQNPYRSEE